MFQTRYFFLHLPQNVTAQQIAEKLKPHWFASVDADKVFDAILRQVMDALDIYPFITDKITLNVVHGKLPLERCRLTGKVFTPAAKYQSNMITASIDRFNRDVFQHECAHAVLDHNGRNSERISGKAEEVLAMYVDSQL